MDHSILVNEKIEAGSKLIKILVEKGAAPTAALWFYYPDTDSWKLIIASKFFDGEKYKDSFRVLTEILRHEEFDNLDVSEIRIQNSNDPLIKGLGQFFNVENSQVRLTKNYFNEIYVEDALIYRMKR